VLAEALRGLRVLLGVSLSTASTVGLALRLRLDAGLAFPELSDEREREVISPH
jgi:hypothetical protein